MSGYSTSTRSMMPTIAASTGAPLRPSASPAARPSRTTSTFSRTPAPTPSTASSAVPRGVSSRFNGCTSSSLAPSNLACFWVDTTVPMTLAICIEIPMVDNADDARVDRRLNRVEGEAGFPAADEEDFFADSGAHRIDRDQRPARVLTFGSQRLENQQLEA